MTVNADADIFLSETQTPGALETAVLTSWFAGVILGLSSGILPHSLEILSPVLITTSFAGAFFLSVSRKQWLLLTVLAIGFAFYFGFVLLNIL